MPYTVKLCGGKYEFDLEDGQLVAARLNHVDWPAGFEWRFSKAVAAMLLRIQELETRIHDDGLERKERG